MRSERENRHQEALKRWDTVLADNERIMADVYKKSGTERVVYKKPVKKQ